MLSEYILSGASGGPYGTAIAMTLLIRIELSLGEFDDGGEHARALIEIADVKLGSPMYGAAARTQLASVSLAGGEGADAERLAHEALATAVARGYRRLVPPVLELQLNGTEFLSHVEPPSPVQRVGNPDVPQQVNRNVTKAV